MRELGWVYGRDFVTERRAYGDQLERIPDLAVELSRKGVDVFLVQGAPQAARVQQVTQTIPIVATSADLVAAGRATGLARPGANVTGVQTLGQLAGKHLSLLREVIVGFSRAGVLETPDGDQGIFAAYIQEAEASAKALNVLLQVPTVHGAGDFATAFAAFRHDRAQAILVHWTPVLVSHFKTVAALALKHRLPTISDLPDFASAGGLMTYGVNGSEVSRLVADIIDKIFRGAKASEVPIRQATTFWLAINLKTAKALGLTIPPSLLLRADQVIE